MKRNFLKTIPLQIYLFVLILPLIAHFLNVNLFFVLITLYLIYGTTKSFLLLYGTVVGYIEYRKEISIAWYEKLKEILLVEKLELPKHLISIPVNKEGVSIVIRNIDSILAQNYSLENIYIIVSCEHRPDFHKFKSKLEQRYSHQLLNRFWVIEHILDDYEVRGAASNRTNGVRTAVGILENEGIDIRNFLVTSPDADTVFHKEYLARTSYSWIIDSKPENVFYQTGAYRFDNNMQKVPYAIRIVSMGISLGTLSSSITDHKHRYTFSCFTLPLSTIQKIDYWDVSVSIDDAPIYWRAYKFFDGNFTCKSFYIPIFVDCIDSENYWETYTRQYKQIHRWGWGILVFPDAFLNIMDSNISSLEKLNKLMRFVDSMILLKVIPASIVTYLSLFSNRSIVTDTLSFLSVLFIIFSAPFVFKLLLENSKMTIQNIILTMAAFLPFGLIHIFIYCFFPFFQAASEFAIGKDINKQIQWAIKIPNDSTL
jgi:hypothetical protein